MAIGNIHMPRHWLSVLLIIGQCPLTAFLRALLRYGKHSEEGYCAAIETCRVQIAHFLWSCQHCLHLYLDPLLGGILRRQR